jgi:hypothetical protein
MRAVRDLRRDAPGPVEEQHQAAVPAAGWFLQGVGSKAWQLTMVILPIVLSIWLTHVSARSEKNVTDRINQQAELQKQQAEQQKRQLEQQMEQQKQVFVEQVHLSQDLYKRQFDTYDKLYAQLLILRSTIDRRNPGSPSGGLNRRFADSLFELDHLRQTNRLHISAPVYNSMGDAWQKGARMKAQDIDQVEDLMEEELKDLMNVEAKLRKESAAK